jgi:hypothetical protein
MQTHKTYNYQSFIYKIGLFGMVFVKTINGWMRSTVTAEELHNADNQRQKKQQQSNSTYVHKKQYRKNAADFKR